MISADRSGESSPSCRKSWILCDRNWNSFSRCSITSTVPFVGVAPYRKKITNGCSVAIALTKRRRRGFVLPRGPVPVPQLNRASSHAKRVLRLLLGLQVEEGIAVPEPLFRFGNLLCNYFFVLTLVVNKAHGVKEIPFISRSYGRAVTAE